MDLPFGWTRLFARGRKPYKEEEAKQAATIVKEGFSRRSLDELKKFLSHPDQRIRIRAQLELTRRPEGFEILANATTAKGTITQLHGIWGLGIIARRSGAVLPTGTTVSNPALREKAATILRGLLVDGASEEARCQAVKALGEAGIEIPLPMSDLIGQEAHPRLQFFATLSAGRLKSREASEAIVKMISKTKDLHLRLAGAHALSLIHSDEELATLSNHKSPSVHLTAVVALRKQKSPALAKMLTHSDQAVVHEAIRAINDRELSKIRGEVASLLDIDNPPERSTMIWQRILHSAFRSGGTNNAKRLLSIALNPSISEQARAESFRLLEQWTEPHPIDQSIGKYSAIPNRPVAEIKPILSGKLLQIIATKGALLDPALRVIRKYDLDLSSVPVDLIRVIVMNKEIPDSARVDGLQFFINRKPKDLQDLINGLLEGSNDALAVAALKHLANTSPEKAVRALTMTTKSKSPYRQQQAWKIASAIKLPAAGRLIADGLENLRANNGATPSALELLEAADPRNEASVVKALASFQTQQSESDDPLAKWLTALEGGNHDRGAQVFNSHPAGQCKRCHAAGHGGGNAGPRLASIGRKKDRRYILESIVKPGAAVALGYGIASATLKGGKVIGGIVINESEDHVDFDSGGTIKRVMRRDMESMTTPVSAMPSMEHLLKPAEVRDLVEWLSKKKKKLRPLKPPERPKPVLVKP